MEASAKRSLAVKMICNLAQSHGEILDEPVLDYLSELLILAVDDEAEITSLQEAISGFLPTTNDAEQILQELMKNYQYYCTSADGSRFALERESDISHPSSLVPSSADHPNDGSMEQTMALKTSHKSMENIGAAIAGIKLSVHAKEFVPHDQIEALMTTEDIYADDCDDEMGLTVEDAHLEDMCSGSVDGGVDGLGLLSCLYPALSIVALQKLLDTNNGDIGLCIRLLGQLSSHSVLSTDVKAPQKPLDMSEHSFPSLPGSELTAMPKVQNHISTHKPFVAALKKKAPNLPEKQDAVSTKSVGCEATGLMHRESGTNPIPWVETGEMVSKQYAEAREEAREYARRRNAYFEQATKAYLSGNKALAKELGIKGRWCCDRMKECHAIASEAIFQERNKLFHAGKVNGPIVFDLHGLHVSEAERILQRELKLLSHAGGSTKTISLLVGTGHHTKGTRTPSRLPHAVCTFLDTNGYIHKQGKPGVIEVRL